MPVTVSFITVLVNAALNFELVRVMGYRGLALGTSIAALLNAGLLLVMLRRRLGGIEGGAIISALLRIGIAAALMGAAAVGADAFLAERIPGNGIAAQLVRVGATIGLALAVLAVAAHVLARTSVRGSRFANQAPPAPQLTAGPCALRRVERDWIDAPALLLWLELRLLVRSGASHARGQGAAHHQHRRVRAAAGRRRASVLVRPPACGSADWAPDWQPLTYMFLHGSISHILFNMLSLWMFGVEMERMWGTRFFTRYYLVCGVGAAATTIVMSFFPGEHRRAALPVADGRRIGRHLRSAARLRSGTSRTGRS